MSGAVVVNPRKLATLERLGPLGGVKPLRGRPQGARSDPERKRRRLDGHAARMRNSKGGSVAPTASTMDLAQLLGSARTRRLHSREIALDAFRERNETICGLIEMRKAGVLDGIWCDADALKIRVVGEEFRYSVSWDHARRIVRKFLESCGGDIRMQRESNT